MWYTEAISLTFERVFIEYSFESLSKGYYLCTMVRIAGFANVALVTSTFYNPLASVVDSNCNHTISNNLAFIALTTSA